MFDQRVDIKLVGYLANIISSDVASYVPSADGWVVITVPVEAASSVCDEHSDRSLVTEIQVNKMTSLMVTTYSYIITYTATSIIV